MFFATLARSSSSLSLHLRLLTQPNNSHQPDRTFTSEKTHTGKNPTIVVVAQKQSNTKISLFRDDFSWGVNVCYSRADRVRHIAASAICVPEQFVRVRVVAQFFCSPTNFSDWMSQMVTRTRTIPTKSCSSFSSAKAAPKQRKSSQHSQKIRKVAARRSPPPAVRPPRQQTISVIVTSHYHTTRSVLVQLKYYAAIHLQKIVCNLAHQRRRRRLTSQTQRRRRKLTSLVRRSRTAYDRSKSWWHYFPTRVFQPRLP